MASEFLDLVRKSGLVENDQLDKFLADLKKARGGMLPREKDELADALIEAELITVLW